jgi:glutaredoxin 3
MPEVTVYSTRSCPYCRQAEKFLHARGVAFTTIDVTGDDEMRVRLVELSGGLRTVPQIFIGGKPIGGYTDMVALDRKGALDALLKDGSGQKSP